MNRNVRVCATPRAKTIKKTSNEDTIGHARRMGGLRAFGILKLEGESELFDTSPSSIDKLEHLNLCGSRIIFSKEQPKANRARITVDNQKQQFSSKLIKLSRDSPSNYKYSLYLDNPTIYGQNSFQTSILNTSNNLAHLSKSSSRASPYRIASKSRVRSIKDRINKLFNT